MQKDGAVLGHSPPAQTFRLKSSGGAFPFKLNRSNIAPSLRRVHRLVSLVAPPKRLVVPATGGLCGKVMTAIHLGQMRI